MICKPCHDNAHRACASGTWCDCQHKRRQDGAPAGSVRELAGVRIISYGPDTMASVFPGASPL